MDDSDKATQQEMMATDLAIRLARAGAGAAIVRAEGYCLNCGDDLPAERRWCGPDCRDDWQRRSIRNG